MTIYRCLQQDPKTSSPRLIEVYQAQTEREAITYLQANGGGVYRNVLHHFDCPIQAKP